MVQIRGLWVLVAMVLGSVAARAEEPAVPASVDPPIAPVEAPKPQTKPDLMGGMGGPGGGFGGGGMGAPGYDVRGYFSRPTPGQSADLGFVRQSLNAMLPLWTDGGDMLAANVRVQNTLFKTDAILPDTRRNFPDQLWNVGMGLTYMHRLENGWSVGGMLNIGSASDQPFHSIHETTVSGIAMLRIPAARDGDWWMLGLMYSPNGQVAFPIPIVSYQWHPTDRITVGLGLPLSLSWRPTDEWRVDLSYAPLTTVHAQISWLPRKDLRIYGGFDWDSEGYLLANRADTADRFFAIEKRLGGGVRYDLFERLTIDVNGGYAFDRSFGTGQNALALKTDRVVVGAGAYLGGKLQLKF